MGNKRLVYGELFEDDTLGTLPRDARLLWVGLIAAIADDQGRMLDNTALIRAKIFMYDTDVTNQMVDEWLQMLADAGMVTRYAAEGKNLLQIVNWWEYQKSGWANYSKFAPPAGWVDRVKIRNSQNSVDMVNWDNPGGFTTTQTPGNSNTGTEGSCNTGTGVAAGQERGVAVTQEQGVTVNNGQNPVQNNQKPSTKEGVRVTQERGVEHPVRVPQVKVKVKEKVNVKEKVKEQEPSQDGIYKNYASVWETEMGMLVTGYTAFCKMVDEFAEVGVTPELYRVAIREQKNSKYPVTNPTSVKNWALGLVNDTQGDNGKKPVKTRTYIGPRGEKKEVVING